MLDCKDHLLERKCLLFQIKRNTRIELKTKYILYIKPFKDFYNSNSVGMILNFQNNGFLTENLIH